jgi:hypothetical protein
MRQRPLIGGVFGDGWLVLATLPVVDRGLHAVKHMVLDPRRGVVFSMSMEKREAIAMARRFLRGPANDPSWHQAPLFPELDAGPAPRHVRPPSRRRREVFARCDGRCHYCSTRLELAGNWHVDHVLSRALGGTDHGLNLVAACAACNLSKGPRSGLEFVLRDER